MATIKANDHHYCFEPKQKYGKCGYEVTDGSPLGESYRCVLNRKTPTTETQYTKVTDKELLLPDGYYVWWGPSNIKSSMYGTEKLTTSFKSALGKFKWFHRDPDEPSQAPDVYFRVGGTLRYKKEICYVIVIHTGNGASDEIEKLPPLRSNAHFKLNGFLDARGRVNWDRETVPEFTPGQFEGGCKDHFAFAFYFNDCENPFRLEKVDKSQVSHDRCLHSFKVKPEFCSDPDHRWYCPEDERLPKKSQKELEDTN